MICNFYLDRLHGILSTVELEGSSYLLTFIKATGIMIDDRDKLPSFSNVDNIPSFAYLFYSLFSQH